MEKYLKEIATTTGATVYLFICGALYTFFYWSLFNFDITDLITVADIPKSIFTAIFFSIGMFGLLVLLYYLLESIKIESKFWRFCLRFIGFLVLYGFLFGFPYFYLIFVIIVFGVTIGTFMLHEKLYKFSQEHRDEIFSFLLFIPVLCSVLGVLNGVFIRNNAKRTNFVSQIQSSDTALIRTCLHKKLLGYVGDKVVLSDLKNSEFIVVNQSSFNSISFTTDTSLFVVSTSK